MYLKTNAVFNTVAYMAKPKLKTKGLIVLKVKKHKRAMEKRLLKLQSSFGFWINNDEIIIWR